MQNDTIIVSTLEVYVNWTKHKVFTCFTAFEDRNLSGPVLNASLTVATRPEQTSIIGVRFIETSDHQLVESLEIYWRQSEEFNYTYSIRYSIDDDVWGKKSYTINDIECHYRSNDVYRVPNTTGHICKASIKAEIVQLYREYKMYLVTTRDQCEIRGPTKKFELWPSGKDPGPNKYELFLIPHPVSDFRIRVVRQQVELTWTNMPNFNRWYRLHYNCSELGVAKEQTIIGKTELTLYGSNFTAYRPYALCAFCIQVYIVDSEIPSLPFCREARLHEEAPSKPPTITCIAKECATITDGRFRNVTIPWSLPPRETWNGVLTHVVVKYRRAENGEIRKKRKQKEGQLPKLNEPLDYDNVCGDQIAPKDYDVLSDDVLIGQGESNAGLEPSDYSQETSL
ncbi:Hypothetical predicted protein [Paramuricea clavata]|uniref:Uncharacterized protein n=1 Tax=Paramuricea clavata TaxID=317549 RepID=A0A7D9EZ57_PARCT|nr:Hypothetical predicted protein [Paramuricea clavata]